MEKISYGNLLTVPGHEMERASSGMGYRTVNTPIITLQ
jgi:hypothetical protein